MYGFQLLDKPMSGATNPAYRGVYRPSPSYIDHQHRDSEINKLWFQDDSIMLDGVFINIDQAKMVQDIYATSGFYFDLMEVVTFDGYPSEKQGVFIGCDIAHVSSYSLLSWDLNFEQPASEFFHQRQNPIYKPLLLLIQDHFRPLLNEYRLLSTVKDAAFFLDVANALTVGFGAVWESVEYGRFNLLQLYMVRSCESLYLERS